MSPSLPDLLLGTAQWGWTVDRNAAFQILDAWYAAGYREIDAATNYPINKNPADFRAAEKILEEYIQAHGVHDLAVTMKIGSLDNMRSPESNLSPSFVLMMAGEYRRLLGDNLRGLMLHWDNRADEGAIRSTLSALSIAQSEFGVQPGLSGIAHPEQYARANADLGLRFDIELKHNVLQSDFERYAPFQGNSHRLLAYGINAGGVKLQGRYPAESTLVARGGDPAKLADILERLRSLLGKLNLAFVRPPLLTMNHVGLVFAGLNPGIGGIILGISSVAQLRETLDFWRNLEVFDFKDAYHALGKLHVLSN